MKCAPPSSDELQALLLPVIQRIVRLLTRTGHLIEEQGMSYLAEADAQSRSRLCKWQPTPIALRWGLGPSRKY